MISNFEAKDFYPTITIIYFAAVGVQILSDMIWDDLLWLIAVGVHFILQLLWVFLVIAKAGGIMFNESAVESNRRIQNGASVKAVLLGHTLSMLPFVLLYPLIYSWHDISAWFAVDVYPEQQAWGAEAKALGLVVDEFHDMMDYSLSRFENFEYTEEQWQFLERAFEGYPQAIQIRDVLGYGIMPPGRGFFMILVLGMAVTGWMLRRRIYSTANREMPIQ